MQLTRGVGGFFARADIVGHCPKSQISIFAVARSSTRRKEKCLASRSRCRPPYINTSQGPEEKILGPRRHAAGHIFSGGYGINTAANEAVKAETKA